MKARGQGLIYRRGKVWWCQYYVRGTRYRESSKSDNRADAVRLLKKKIAESLAGKPAGNQAEKTTLAHLLAMLETDYQVNGRRLRALKGPLKHLRAYFGPDCLALDITSDRLTAFGAERLAAGAKNATVNRVFAALRRAFYLASIAGKVNTTPHFPMLKEDNRRKGFFEHDQYLALFRHLPEDLKPVIQVAYVTGWRVPSEILTRQKHHVDLQAGWLRLDPGETKSKEGRMFPLTPELRQVLEGQMARTRAFEVSRGVIVPWLFHRSGKPIRDYHVSWGKACAAAGVPGRIPHDFRRTAVRNLERAGVPRSAAMAMVGHRTEAIYRRYAIADETMLRDGAERLAKLHYKL